MRLLSQQGGGYGARKSTRPCSGTREGVRQMAELCVSVVFHGIRSTGSAGRDFGRSDSMPTMNMIKGRRALLGDEASIISDWIARQAQAAARNAKGLSSTKSPLQMTSGCSAHRRDSGLFDNLHCNLLAALGTPLCLRRWRVSCTRAARSQISNFAPSGHRVDPPLFRLLIRDSADKIRNQESRADRWTGHPSAGRRSRGSPSC